MPVTKEKTQLTLKKVFAFLKENKEDLAIQEMTELLMEIEEDKRNFVEKSELRELIIEMKEGFRRMDERFEAIDKRFEAIDKRFEELIHNFDKRFEAIDKRFEDLLHYVDKRFEAVDKRFQELIHYMDKRFEAVDKRFEAIDKRFEEQQNNFNKRFEDIHKRFNFLQWFLGISMSIFFSIITIFFSYIAYTSQKQTDLIIQQLENLQKVIVEQKVK